MLKKFAGRLRAFLVNYFTLSAQLVPQAEAEASIREDVTFRGTNIIILVLAILIASLGLNTNSTAVIIGAMLISPLMGPIIGIGLGLGVYDFDLIKRALRNLVMAAGFSIVASTLYFLISPVGEGHSELLARTSPTIYDVLIGFVGGGAGILAIGSRHKGNVVPGVAIATALMPPLCTAGYGLATWQINYFFGAAYLFVINSIYIAFATFIGVKLLGYKAEAVADGSRAKHMRRVVYSLAVLTMLPSVWLTYNMLRETRFSMQAKAFVSHECKFDGTQVVADKAFTENGTRVISMTLIGRPLSLDSLDLALSSRLKFYGLAGTELRFVQGGAVITPVDLTSSNMHDVFEMAQSTIIAQQRQIDSLSRVVLDSRKPQAAGVEIAPEIKVLFPQVQDIAVTRSVFSSVEHQALDTVNLVLVHYSSAMSGAQRAKFKEYMQARLKLGEIAIVETGDISNVKQSKQ